MKKSIEKKIIEQFYRLAEKQYRKGFQQGFYASEGKQLTKDKVDNFRSKGMTENYTKIVNPFMNFQEIPKFRILEEIKMSDMEELRDFINTYDTISLNELDKGCACYGSNSIHKCNCK